MINSITKQRKNRPLNLQELRQFIEKENNIQPFEIYTKTSQEKIKQREEREEKRRWLRETMQKVEKEMAAKINLQREAYLSAANNG